MPPSSLSSLALAALPALSGALFAAASASVAALTPARLGALRDTLTGSAQAAVGRYLQDGDVIESRWMVLRVLGISGSALQLASAFPPEWGAWRSLGALVGALLVYGIPAEVLVVLAERTAERTAPRVLQFLRPVELLVAPIAAPLAWLGGLVGKVVRRPSAPTADLAEAEMELLVKEGQQSGAIDQERSEMIRNVLDFGELTAGQVMVSRTRVVGFDVETSVAELAHLAMESGHSRYPLWRERSDNVVGVLHMKDLLRAHVTGDGRTAEQLMRRPVVFAPESQAASAVLKDMRAGRNHLAVVVDEFGGMSGIVTLEDLLEEIVGDIRDEHDDQDAPIADLGDGRLMVDASVSINELSRYLGEELPGDGDYNSLGGFIVERLGRVPAAGARHVERGLTFVVKEADGRRVSRVEIARPVLGPESGRARHPEA